MEKIIYSLDMKILRKKNGSPVTTSKITQTDVTNKDTAMLIMELEQLKLSLLKTTRPSIETESED